MSDMVRKQIYLTRRHNMLLKRLAKTRRVSEAEVIRQALDREERQYLSNLPHDQSAWENIVRYIRERQKLGVSGEPYHWNRAEIYAERENRWIRETNDDDGTPCQKS